jgi:hypothetical protein
MLMIYCNFNHNENINGMVCVLFMFLLAKLVVYFFLIDRKTKMDRIRRRQISVRPFLRPAQL